MYIPPLMKQRKRLATDPDGTPPEYRLWFLLWSAYAQAVLGKSSSTAAPLECIGLFGFAWTSLGPPHVHWIAPMIFSALVGIANVRAPGKPCQS